MIVRLHKDQVQELIVQATAQTLEDLNDAGVADPEVIRIIVENLDWLNSEMKIASMQREKDLAMPDWQKKEDAEKDTPASAAAKALGISLPNPDSPI